MLGFIQRTAGNLIKTVSSTKNSDAALHTPAEASALPFPVYVINLERAEYRRRFALAQLARIGVTPIMAPAVDGRLLDLGKLIEEGIYNPAKSEEAFSRQLSLPEIGCSLSHYNVYRMMIERGDEAALILEDDALFLTDFTQQLLAAYRELPSGWGILNLNCPCQRYEHITENIVKYDGIGSLPVACSAFLLSRRGAELLIENAMPIRYPADSLVGRGLRWGVETYGLVPAITSINNVFPTQIQTPDGISGQIKNWTKNTLAKLLFRSR